MKKIFFLIIICLFMVSCGKQADNTVEKFIDNIKNKNYGDYFVTGVCILDKKAKGRVIDGVTQQIELALTAEFVDQQLRQIAFLALAHGRIGRHDLGGGIDIGRHVVVQFFVGAGETPGLLQAVAHVCE